MHGLYGGGILVQNGVNASAPFLHIAKDSPAKANISIRIYKNLHIHKVAQLFIVQNKYAFNYKYFRWLQRYGFILAAVVNGVIVNRFFDCFAIFQLFYVLNHKLCIKGIRMVVVYKAALLKGEMVKNIVIIVVMNHGYIVFESIYQRRGKGRFSASRSACNTHN